MEEEKLGYWSHEKPFQDLSHSHVHDNDHSNVIESSSSSTCAICLEPDILFEKRVYACYHRQKEMEGVERKETNVFCCVACFSQYFTAKVTEAFHGSCPIITCPLCSKCIVSYQDILEYGGIHIVQHYEDLAKSLLSLQCGGCHTRKTIYVTETMTLDHLSQFCEEFSIPLQLVEEIERFQRGILTISEFYTLFCEVLYPNLMVLSEDDQWIIFQKLLSAIQNPERRANLHLRYIRDRPRVMSLCCKRPHCFKCKTKEYHANQSCEQHTEQLCAEILPCRQCGVSLVKGDGCDSVNCVCGRNFTWSSEMQKSRQASEFVRLFPVDTSRACAEILCGTGGVEVDSKLADSFMQYNELAVKYQLFFWWKRTFSSCPTQAILTGNWISRGPTVAIAAEMWRVRNLEEFSFRQSQREISISELVHSFYRDMNSLQNLIVDAHSYGSSSMILKARDLLEETLFNGPFFRSITKSTEKAMLIQEIQSIVKEPDLNLQIRYEELKAQQFLSIFGHRNINMTALSAGRRESNNEVYISSTSPKELFRKISDLQLQVDDCVLRKGSDDKVGFVTVIHGDGYYDIAYEDGSVENRVNRLGVVKVSGSNRHRYIPSLDMSGQQLKSFRIYISYCKRMRNNRLTSPWIKALAQNVSKVNSCQLNEYFDMITDKEKWDLLTIEKRNWNMTWNVFTSSLAYLNLTES